MLRKNKEKETKPKAIKIIVWSILLIPLFGLFFSFSIVKSKGNSALTDSTLYKNVTLTNLPVAAVSGAGMDVECADIDNDGDPDIFLAIEYSPNKLLLNNGAGIFTDVSSARLPQKNLDSEDITLADFDNDGDLDVVFATEDHRIHEYYLNNGSGFFTTDVSSRLPNSTANSVLAADINNDSIPDLVFGNANPNDTPGQNFILINNGDGTFRDESVQRLGAVLDVTQDIKMGDLDGDGDLDMVAGNEDGNKLYLNNGAGFFSDETTAGLPLPLHEETRKVTLEDIDNDGDLDIYFANVNFGQPFSAQDRLLINNGHAHFTDETASREPTENFNTLEGIFMDFDFDGHKDLITGLGFTGRAAQVFKNNGSNIFTEAFPPEIIPAGLTGDCLGIKTADFNNDNLNDIYLVVRGGRDILLFRKDTSSVGINSQYQYNEVPGEIKLYPNFPNPFNPVTNISFDVDKAGLVKLEVLDLSGKVVAVLLNEKMPAGNHSVTFNGDSYPSGAYFYRLTSNGYSVVDKMVLLK